MPVNLPAEALGALKAGNERFVAGASQSSPFDPRLWRFEGGQYPHSVVLGCSDSRVPIETIFDQPPGNVFVVRVAGNFLNPDNLGSIEFAVAALKSKLILVLGHTECGAVTAAVAYARDGTAQPGHIANLVTAIAPSAEAARSLPGDWVANAVAENVQRNVNAMTAASPLIARAVAAGGVTVTGGLYDLGTGKVTFS